MAKHYMMNPQVDDKIKYCVRRVITNRPCKYCRENERCDLKSMPMEEYAEQAVRYAIWVRREDENATI